MKFLRKYHKWVSLIFSLLFILYGLSGIILNHRDWLAPLEISRKLLPKAYRYQNWNNAAVRGTLKTSDQKVYLFGNIGIWKTDTSGQYFIDFNQGLKKGIDNRKTSDMVSWKGQLVAGTFSGLYVRKPDEDKWRLLPLRIKNPWIMDLAIHSDSLYILTRSELLTTNDLINFRQRYLPPSEDYDNQADLFKTLWVIHSGEIYGLPGKILIDLVGIALIYLTLTGLKISIDKIVLKHKPEPRLRQRKKYWIRVNLKWHNKVGYTALAFLLINSLTGIFLRPPFLILAAGERVKKIPYSEIGSPNPWFDQLRQIHYDSLNNFWLVATYNGFYYSTDHFSTPLKRFKHQPPVSIMGINVLKQIDKQQYLVGSFEGLFQWNLDNGQSIDVITGKLCQSSTDNRSPVGQYQITGYSSDFSGHLCVFDYNRGCIDLRGGQPLISMSAEILKRSPLSLWSLALEVHTGRIFQPLIGPFYILIVPLTGLAAIFVLISGFVVWLKSRKAS